MTEEEKRTAYTLSQQSVLKGTLRAMKRRVS